MAKPAAAQLLSEVPDVNMRIGPGILIGSTNGRRVEGQRVEASLGADTTLELVFRLPDTLGAVPAVQLYLQAIANASAGDAPVRVQWALVPVGGTADPAALNDEGTQTMSWAAGDAEELKVLAVALDAAQIAQADAGSWLYVLLSFQAAGWTLAAPSYWWATVTADTA